MWQRGRQAARAVARVVFPEEEGPLRARMMVEGLVDGEVELEVGGMVC